MPSGSFFEASSKDLALLLEVGYVYRYAKRFREAREVFQGVRALAPNKELGELALAGLSLDEGKLKDAEEHCRSALKLNPSSAEALAQLAEVQIFQNDKTRARQTLQRALALNPKGPVAELVRELGKFSSIYNSRG